MNKHSSEWLKVRPPVTAAVALLLWLRFGRGKDSFEECETAFGMAKIFVTRLEQEWPDIPVRRNG